jgi:hypothetical protein
MIIVLWSDTMEYLSLIFFFIPFLLLFSMAIEILLRDPHNLLHRTTMVLFLSFGLLFLGDFIMQIFPLEKAGFGEKIKLSAAFVIMTSGLYFYIFLSKSFKSRIIRHAVALLPLFGIVVLFFPCMYLRSAFGRRPISAGSPTTRPLFL